LFELFDAFLQEEPNFSLGYSLISRNLRTFANGIRRKQTKKGVTYGYIGYYCCGGAGDYRRVYLLE
jgi:hypothetical protein